MDQDHQITKTASSRMTIIVFVVSLGLSLVAVTLISLYFSRANHDGDRRISDGGGGEDAAVVDGGDGAVERRPERPSSTYSKAKLLEKGDSCSVCLGEYGESDRLRLLPDCGHVFHLKCVDSWLRLRATCPLCRTLPSDAVVSNMQQGV